MTILKKCHVYVWGDDIGSEVQGMSNRCSQDVYPSVLWGAREENQGFGLRVLGVCMSVDLRETPLLSHSYARTTTITMIPRPMPTTMRCC